MGISALGKAGGEQEQLFGPDQALALKAFLNASFAFKMVAASMGLTCQCHLI